MTEARNYHGFDPDGDANTEADHFGNCSAGPTLIEIGEGAEPPARDGMRKGALAGLACTSEAMAKSAASVDTMPDGPRKWRW